MIRATRARVTNCRMKINDLYARLHDIIYYMIILKIKTLNKFSLPKLYSSRDPRSVTEEILRIN